MPKQRTEVADIERNGFERFERGAVQDDASCAECPGCPKAGDAQ